MRHYHTPEAYYHYYDVRGLSRCPIMNIGLPDSDLFRSSKDITLLNDLKFTFYYSSNAFKHVIGRLATSISTCNLKLLKAIFFPLSFDLLSMHLHVAFVIGGPVLP